MQYIYWVNSMEGVEWLMCHNFMCMDNFDMCTYHLPLSCELLKRTLDLKSNLRLNLNSICGK
jgi:hypothetical protein